MYDPVRLRAVIHSIVLQFEGQPVTPELRARIVEAVGRVFDRYPGPVGDLARFRVQDLLG